MSPDLLQAATGCTAARAAIWALPLTAAMNEFEIDTRLRRAAFLAMVAHESGLFRYTHELGSDSYLARYDTGRLAARLGNTPEADGDGQRYKGRGPIQITGHDNYAKCGEALGLPLLEHPELLEDPMNGARAAGWFWADKDLNALADRGRFDLVTQRVNGGMNGWDDRRALYALALKVLA